MRWVLIGAALVTFPLGRYIGRAVNEHIERPGREFREKLRQETAEANQQIHERVVRDKAEAARKTEYIIQTLDKSYNREDHQ